MMETIMKKIFVILIVLTGVIILIFNSIRWFSTSDVLYTSNGLSEKYFTNDVLNQICIEKVVSTELYQ